jgi:16S rRNA (uracil1498-N3)-methyltransferase
MPRFYVDTLLNVGDEVSLPPDVVRHITVLRLKLQQEVTLFNNDGHDYHAKIVELGRREASVVINNKVKNQTEANLIITLMISLISNDKLELVIQKAVELGVQRIIPVITEKTQRIKAEREASKLEHWRKIIIAASEQCGRAKLATVSEIKEFATVIDEDKSEINYILSPHHAASKLAKVNNPQSISLLIGPEGGFTESEIRLANEAGFHNLNLGKRILRAETAAIAGISFLHCNFGDFKIV